MTSLGFIRLFSSPLWAFLVSAIIVSGCGYGVYRSARNKSAPAAARYWKLLSLAAEICVAVGLIGLATFTGRMKISADHQLLEERVRLSQAAVDERFRVAALSSCEPSGPRPLAPFNPSVARKELCAIARTFVGVNVADAQYQSAEQVLRDFGARYPGCVENVFSRHSECGDTVAAATQLADDIRVLDTDKQASRNDESMSAMLEAPTSWGVLLLAFLIAAVGVSIKCARAAAQYLDGAASD